MSVIVRRKARKVHYCDSCSSPIEPGEAYLTHTALAGDGYYHDALDRDTLKPANCPIRLKECADCATRYRRAELLGASRVSASMAECRNCGRPLVRGQVALVHRLEDFDRSKPIDCFKPEPKEVAS